MPKSIPTVRVKLKKFKNQIVLINESDFNSNEHSKITEKKAAVKSSTTKKVNDKAVKTEVKALEDDNADSISD